MHAIIESMQKIVGVIIVNPFVDFKNPFEAIPRIIVRSNRYILINLSWI